MGLLFAVPLCPSCLSQPSSLRARAVAMKSALLPVLALWVGCSPGGALANQGLGLRKPTALPAPWASRR